MSIKQNRKFRVRRCVLTTAEYMAGYKPAWEVVEDTTYGTFAVVQCDTRAEAQGYAREMSR